MSSYETAIKKLLELKKQHDSWQSVADSLSQNSRSPISKAAVWKMANGRTKSPRIMKALGLDQKRYRRCGEFENEDQLQAWDRYTKMQDISLTMICKGLLDGSIKLTVDDDWIQNKGI